MIFSAAWQNARGPFNLSYFMIPWDAEFMGLYFDAGNRRDMARPPADLLSLIPPHLTESKPLLTKGSIPFP